jgi:hypothetical protein
MGHLIIITLVDVWIDCSLCMVPDQIRCNEMIKKWNEGRKPLLK